MRTALSVPIGILAIGGMFALGPLAWADSSPSPSSSPSQSSSVSTVSASASPSEPSASASPSEPSAPPTRAAAETATISGKIVDEAGKPFEDLDLQLRGFFSYGDRTGTDGTYSVKVAPGTYTLSLDCGDSPLTPGFPFTTAYICPAPTTAVEAVAKTKVTADLVAPRSAKIEGTIVGTKWRSPVMWVAFNESASASAWAYAGVQPDGSFAFYNNNSSPVRGRVFALDIQSFVDDFPPSGESAELTIAPGQLVTGVEVRPNAAAPSTSPTTPDNRPSTAVASADPGLPPTGANTVPIAAGGLILLTAGTAVLILERHTRLLRH